MALFPEFLAQLVSLTVLIAKQELSLDQQTSVTCSTNNAWMVSVYTSKELLHFLKTLILCITRMDARVHTHTR